MPVPTGVPTCARIALLACASISAASAYAQRANENAIRSAEDAFGTSIGRESIGLYGPGNVRGFSPIQAGNVRLEGLYLDAAAVPNARLIRSSTVRVGISAQGYPFTAPTGVADYRLRLPGAKPVLSAVLGAVSNGGFNGEVDVQLPLVGDTLGFGGGIGASYDKQLQGGSAVHASAAALLRWRPSNEVEVIPFWSRHLHHDEDSVPRIITAGDYLPPKIRRGRFFGQRWAKFQGSETNVGVLGRFTQGNMSLNAGMFRSALKPGEMFSDQFLNTSRDGLAARHRIVITPDQLNEATSGELLLSYRLADDDVLRHVIHLSGRGRTQKRLYGGSVAFNFGPARIDERVELEQPQPVFGRRSRDDIRQYSGGIAYQGQWRDVGELTLSLSKTDYRKEVQRPGRTEPITRARPWLYNAAVAMHASPKLAFYGGITRGLEESGAAPETAVNRNEAPPALITRQYDGGLRWAVTPKLKLVSGLFSVEKPYFSLDESQVYRRLGEVRHRGAEISVSGEVMPNLNIVTGAILLDAQVRGEAVEAGRVGERPVGIADKTILLSAEYRLPAVEGLSFDASMTLNGKRAANVLNSFFVKPSEHFGAGLRYRWTMGKMPLTFRAQVNNIFNSYDWQLQGPNTYVYNAPRHISIRLAADFQP